MAETTNPTRNPNDALVSTREGNLGNVPSEFVASTVVETTTQTGISATDSLTPPNAETLVESQLNQTLTREKSIIQKTADFTGLSLTQQITDSIYGITALVTKSIVPSIGGVFEVLVTDPGSGYMSATATSPTPTGGRPATYVVTLAGDGIGSITVIYPGSGYSTAPLVIITGDGTGAAATAVIPTVQGTGKPVASITVDDGGSSYTTATATVPAPTNGVAAVLSVNITGDAITSIDVLESGSGYITPPVITIDGDGVSADATAVLGDTTFIDTDPLDVWRSIQIASKIDLDTLPVELILPKMQRLALPDVLQSIAGQWSSEKGVSKTESVNPPGLSGTAHCTEDGGVKVQIVSGFRGDAKGEFRRKFFSVLPTQSDLPTPTIIKPSLGTCVVTAKGQSVSASYTQNSASGSFSGIIRAHSISIGPVLTASYTTATLTDSDSQTASDSTSGPFLVASYSIEADSAGVITISIPTSTPANFSSGDAIILDGEVSQWRFGIFVLEYNKAFVP